MSKEPEGFTPLTEVQLLAEAKAAESHDRGQRNTKIFDRGSYGKEYHVSEEKRFFDSKNLSLQDVSYNTNGSHNHQTVTLGSTVGDSDRSLVAFSDGAVLFYGINGRAQDLTAELARVGITAAGIRRTQHDIAADGEVSRPEQVKIKQLIEIAQTLADKARSSSNAR